MPALPLKQVLLEQVLREERAVLRPASDSGEAEKPLSALCISGGGIRSATFALGVIQGLADHGLLDKFDYLSTVSGGGYVGGWLTAWIKRAGGLVNVIPCLRRTRQDAAADEAEPIRHLREYSNYLSPKLGLLSADAWTLAATVLRNIFLNWLVLVPLLMGVLIVPRLLLSLFRLGDVHQAFYGTPKAISHSFFVTYALPALCGFMIAYAFFNAARFLPGLGAVDHSQENYLLSVLGPLILANVGYLGFDALYFWEDQWQHDTYLLEVILWIFLPAAAGCLAYLATCGKTARQRARRLFVPLTGALILMTACSGAMAWWLTNRVFVQTSWAQYVALGPPLLLLAFDLGSWVFVGLSSGVLQDEDREWLARSSAWTELFCVSWGVACALVLLAPAWVFNWSVWGKELLAAGGVVSSLVSSLLSGQAEKEGKDKKDKQQKSAGGKSLGFALALAPPIFVAIFAIGLAILTNWLFFQLGAVFPQTTETGVVAFNWSQHDLVLDNTYWAAALIATVGLSIFGWIMAQFININTFSLQGMYRNRLIRAYLGASNPARAASRFTGFSNSDNILMRDLRDGHRPFHVVNVSLNLVAGDRLAWQQRKAESFTISPLYAGNYQLGYRDSAYYGGPQGISLGTAVAISGAAASPNMGSYSSPAVGFIMTLFNARLGSWLGNPGVAGERSWRNAGPSSAVHSLLREALGLTTNDSPYVYLSDGGHFENLALHEMIMRRCRHIVVLDGACDSEMSLGDLRNAQPKIRIDMGVPIEFSDDAISSLRQLRKRCAMGIIRYSAVDSACADGVLIYIKPMVLGNEPPDVQSYAAVNPAFPHESTADQWFSESQTESYRMLGLHTMDEICRGWPGGELPDFEKHLMGYVQAGPGLARLAEA